MKKILFILGWLFVSSVSFSLYAQDETDDDDNTGNEKIRDKMSEYIQKRLNLSKEETEKFAPLFIQYFKEWRQTLRDSRGLPALDRKQKIIDLRVRFRNQFRDIIGEQRSNQVFPQQDAFIREVIRINREKRQNNPGNRPLKQRVRANAVVFN